MRELPPRTPPAADRIVRLSGEHPTLPLAELAALLAVHDPAATTRLLAPTIALVTPGDEKGAATDEAVARMALAHGWAEHWAHGGDVEAVAQAVRARADGQGSVAVRAERAGQDRTLSRTAVERRIGTALVAAGHRIDLAGPGRTIAAWLHDRSLFVGRLLGTLDRGRFEHRSVTHRAHFSPVTLHPRRAAAMVHLARVPPRGRLLDPFCGTGGIVLEAALEGLDAWGSDRDPLMVQGTLQTLADDGEEAVHGTAFVADVAQAPDLVQDVAGTVTDLPYGRASGTAREPVVALYDRALAAFAALLPPGGRAVVGCAAPELLDPGRHGFDVAERHEERIHRSLTRHYLVLRRR